MKPLITHTDRKDIVENTLGTMRIEGMTPTNEVLEAFDAFVLGSKTIEQIIQEIKDRYVALRR
jgi:hypothetical protein